jgi:hypothetical protein
MSEPGWPGVPTDAVAVPPALDELPVFDADGTMATGTTWFVAALGPGPMALEALTVKS